MNDERKKQRVDRRAGCPHPARKLREWLSFWTPRKARASRILTIKRRDLCAEKTTIVNSTVPLQFCAIRNTKLFRVADLSVAAKFVRSDQLESLPILQQAKFSPYSSTILLLRLHRHPSTRQLALQKCEHDRFYAYHNDNILQVCPCSILVDAALRHRG